MCAKKTPTTPTKQNALTGVAKAPAKKAPAPKQTTKAKADDPVAKTSALAKEVKTSADAKKSDAKSTATSNKKPNKASESKAPSNPTTPIKASTKQTQSAKETKKTASRDSSADNGRNKKQPPPPPPPPSSGKAGKVRAADSDHDKLAENKSNHIRDNKINVKNDEVKSKCNAANEQCNKFEKSSSTLSLKSNGESDNVIKGKKAKASASSPKKASKSADKAKSPKIVKKDASKEKIKISNELKNLGIEMSNSNASLAVVLQSGIEGLTGGVKTSICEMVKTKARGCSNTNSCPKTPSTQAKKGGEAKSQSKAHHESQEKVLKDVDSGAKVTSKSAPVADSKAKCAEPAKLIESPKAEEKTPPSSESEVRAAGNGRTKISALVNAKNKIRMSNESKKCEVASKSSESEPSKPAKRRNVKKTKSEDAADSAKNISSAAPNGACRNDKIDPSKSNCVNISDGKRTEIKVPPKAVDTLPEEEVVREPVAAVKSGEATDKQTPSKPKPAAKAKNQLQEGSKVKSAKKFDEAAKMKRKYVKKVKSLSDEAGEKPQRDEVEKPKAIKLERDKSTDTNDSKKPPSESPKKPKSSSTALKDDGKKSNEKVVKTPTATKKDAPKVESASKAKSKSCEKKSTSKASAKKQKIEIKQEADARSSDEANSSDSDSELSSSTFKKPNKPAVQRALRNKKQKQIVFKRSRVASLNAIAKVHFLYENEARSTLEANIAMAIKNSLEQEAGSSDGDDEDDAKSESQEVDLTAKR